MVVRTQKILWSMIPRRNMIMIDWGNSKPVILERPIPRNIVVTKSTTAMFMKRYWWTQVPGAPKMFLNGHFSI